MKPTTTITAAEGQTEFIIPFDYLRGRFVKCQINGTDIAFSEDYTVADHILTLKIPAAG